jgi:uncharacterized protein YjbK
MRVYKNTRYVEVTLYEFEYNGTNYKSGKLQIIFDIFRRYKISDRKMVRRSRSLTRFIKT